MDKILFRQIDAPEIRKSDDKESRKVTFVASDGSRDSAGTVLNQSGWDLSRFNTNGIIGYQHKVYGGWDDTENPDNVIGKGHAYVEDDKLMVDIEFEPADINELADKIYKKVLFGSLKAVSVGFLPLGKGSWGKGEESIDGKTPTYYYAGQQLLEVSVVNIPANPNALKKSFVQESNEAEMEELRKQAAPAKADEPATDNKEQERCAAAATALTMAETIARAALLG